MPDAYKLVLKFREGDEEHLSFFLNKMASITRATYNEEKCEDGTFSVVIHATFDAYGWITILTRDAQDRCISHSADYPPDCVFRRDGKESTPVLVAITFKGGQRDYLGPLRAMDKFLVAQCAGLVRSDATLYERKAVSKTVFSSLESSVLLQQWALDNNLNVTVSRQS